MQSAVSRRPDAPEAWLRALATLYLDQKQYEPAAKLLSEGLEAGRIAPTPQVLDVLTLAWTRAGHPDRAEPVLRKVSERAADGRADLRLGQLLIQQKRFPEASDALSRAIAKGRLDEPAQAELLLGIARFENGDYAAARAPLEKAEADTKTRAEAREYLDALADKAGGSRR
jgi:Tfp pilus assembly protein PilF